MWGYNSTEMNTLLAAILLVSLLNLVLFACITIAIRAFYRSMSSFLVSPDGKSASPAALVFDALSKSFVERLKLTLMGVVSGTARGQQAVMGEIIEQATASSSPLAAGLMSLLPKSGKLFAKNPMLAQWLLGLVTKQGGHKAQAAGDGGGSGFAENAGKYG